MTITVNNKTNTVTIARQGTQGPPGGGGGGSGDVVGPASSTSGDVALFDGATGKLLKDGGALGTAAAHDVGDFATAAQGTKADSATQPGDLATVATTGAYADLSGLPTLGTAAAENVGYFATAAQGGLADTALQPAAIGSSIQAYDADLGAIAALSPTNDDILQRKAGVWTNRTMSQLATDLQFDGGSA